MGSLFSYIDPVSGTMVLQLIVASVAGFAACFLKPIGRLAARLLRRQSEDPQLTERMASMTQKGPEPH
jgi:hypothetical protein